MSEPKLFTDPSGIHRPELSDRTDRELRQHNARHRISERRQIVQKLRQELATDGLALHFQPIVSLQNGWRRVPKQCCDSITPARLELLITEAMLLDDNEDTSFSLRAVQGLGVRLTLNQFGSGYASLAILKRLPISGLRLDKSMVQNLNVDPASATIIHAAVEAGHAMGCSVLADGVESSAQYDLLRHARVDEGQGPFFGNPMPSTEFAEMFRAR